MQNKILKIALIVWVVLWIWFVSRELFLKSTFRDYTILLSRSLEGKRSYVMDDNFYRYLMFCKETMPQGATYFLDVHNGNFDRSLYKVRAAYCLYPDLEKEDAEFILTYGITEERQ